MKRINFNKDWEFTLENSLDTFNIFGLDKYGDASGAAARFYDHSNWERIDLPHDWAVALPKDLSANTFAGARANTHFHRFMTERHSEIEKIYNIGWYRKQFFADPSLDGKRIFIEFEGVFRDATVFVNGAYMDRHTSGYTSFILELTDHLRFGEENSVAVRVDSDQAEGWWYEGSGIYRNVNLIVGEPVYLKYNKTVVKTELDGSVGASAVLVNDTAKAVTLNTRWEILDADGRTVAETETEAELSAYSEKKVSAALRVDEPRLWSVDDPNLYTLRITVGEESEETVFGIRTVGFDPDRGFLLNGKETKVRGACVHQDFGGVGVALTDDLNYYKIQKLKEMGVNAYRCAHHAPSPSLLRACDELGMLVMNETRMFGTSEEAVRQLTALIERDRNHPSVFIWSLGNEEFTIQNESWSRHLMEKATRLAKALDDTRPVTFGGNNGPNDTGINGVSEIRGVNYIRCSSKILGDWLWEYHKAHPDQPIIGTEESSYVLSRGGAKNDLGSGLLDSTGGVTMPWASTPKGWVKYMEERPYFSGSFMWTGFDYRGEPNPFITANVASSFGTIDLCGMEKPPFYYYKAWWTDEDMLKLTPHWNHKDGETVTLAVLTNCEEITLYVNGRAIETKKVERFDLPLFTLPFEAGVVAVEGIRNGKLLRDELRTSKKTAEVGCTLVHKAESGEDTAIYELNAYDSEGIFCPLAGENMELTVEGGQIVGVGNGDPACLDYEQKPKEEEAIYIRTFGYEKGMYSVPMKIPNMHRRRYDWMERRTESMGYEDDYRDVAIFKDDLTAPETLTFVTKLRDVESYRYIEFERLGGEAEVYLNGKKIGDNIRKYGRISANNVRPYRFYCEFCEGENELKIVTVQKESSAYPMSGYVKVGRAVETPWRVRLHYGKARVFVRSETPEAVKVTAKIVR